MLAIDVFPCEDGHTKERALLDQLLATVEPKDLWIEDRNFCTLDFRSLWFQFTAGPKTGCTYGI